MSMPYPGPDSRIQMLEQQCSTLFSNKSTLLSLQQEIADHFYVERADFTVSRHLGTEYAAGLMTSYPLLVRRDLGNSLSSMLRPSSKPWFHTTTNREDKLDQDGRRWLEWATGVQRRVMYDRDSMFVRATKEGDHDYATFGQCVISVELNETMTGLVFRCWHLRDVVWFEDHNGKICGVYRKAKHTARDLAMKFPGRCSKAITDCLEKEPFKEFEIRHAVLPIQQYDWCKGWSDDKKTKAWRKAKYVSVYYEPGNKNVLEEVPSFTLKYVIPRWQTVSGSQYAYSPATICALPDARLLQAMTRVLLEAGEMAINPPLLAKTQQVRGDVSLFAGGITSIDSSYDERQGEVLRPLNRDLRGIPLGRDMQADTRQMLMEAFFLNKLSLPPYDQAGKMTAYEASERVKEYIRQSLPLFEPMEVDYNGALCEEAFTQILHAGGFGSYDNIPDSLSGADIQFKFESPLTAAIDSEKGLTLQQSKALLAQVIDIDQGAMFMLDARKALRDALQGAGTPASWIRSDDEMGALASQHQQQQAVDQTLARINAGSQIASNFAKIPEGEA